MYRWYEESTVCYAYLAKVPPHRVAHRPPYPSEGGHGWLCTKGRDVLAEDKFQSSEWLNRGWTLQELLAPTAVIFLDGEWQEMGTKAELWHNVTLVTGIPGAFLCGRNVRSASSAQKLAWAAHRTTTRVEDGAYSLMGLFGVNMPLLYGERENAFLRLQEEILKVSDDYSIFAWHH